MLKFGIIGTNFISEWFAAACRVSGGRAEATAVYSRTMAKGEEFAAAQGIGQAFDNLDAMIDAVDVVYIASPISAHRDQALTAVAAGRHVLVEKTMGATASEVREILDTAAAAGVVAMEAVRNVHAPAHQLIRDALPRLGTLRHARLEKQQYSSRYDRVRAGELLNAFDPSLGNSALADIGVYVLQPALDLFGPPTTVAGASAVLANGFEGSGTMLLGYGSMVAEVVWSKITRGVVPSVIDGEDGSLLINDLAEPSSIVLRPRGGTDEVLLAEAITAPDTMIHELNAFLDQVDAGHTDPRWSELSVLSRHLMDDHLAQL